MLPICDIGLVDLSGLSDQSLKDKSWTRHRINADSLQVSIALSDYSPKNFSVENWVLRMAKCAQSLHFAVDQTQSGRVFTLQKADFCRVPVCPVCSWRRSLKWRARLIKGFTALVQAHKGYQFLFLTLTVRNCVIGSLRPEIDAMVGAWDKLRKRRCFPAVGYVRSLEVTRNPQTSECHPHFHCLLMVPDSYFGKAYLSQSRWTELWQEALGVGYNPVVHIKKVRDRQSSTVLDGQSEILLPSGLIIGILETAKYCVKPGDLLGDPIWTLKVADQIFRLQKIVTGGFIRQFVNSIDDDLIHIDDTSTQLSDHDYRLIFDWHPRHRKYLERSNV